MKCPKCGGLLKTVQVEVEGAEQKVRSYQCQSCDYFSFDPTSSRKVVEELRATPLQIKQHIVKLSQDRLGMYFNKHIIESLSLENGREIRISVPDKNHIVIEL
ncbi:MAG: hypothetical protein ABIA93_01360 [Candidatus Woesearchaeota archaeon]